MLTVETIEQEMPEFFWSKPAPMAYQAPHNPVERTGGLQVHYPKGK